MALPCGSPAINSSQLQYTTHTTTYNYPLNRHNLCQITGFTHAQMNIVSTPNWRGPTLTSTTHSTLTAPQQSTFRTKLSDTWKHTLDLDDEPPSLAGFCPVITTCFKDPPHVVTLARPKIMESKRSFFRGTKTHCMSSFPMQLLSIHCTKRTVGVPNFNANDWMSLDDNGDIKKQSQLVQTMSLKSETVRKELGDYDPSTGEGSGPRHGKEFYDVILTGSLADGTSITVHVPDFVPWTVWQFPDNWSKDAIFKAVSDLQRISNQSLALSNTRFEVQYREPSDGNTPDKRNPYLVAKKHFVYVYNKDASWNATEAVKQMMINKGAVQSEDDGLSNDLRFQQLTGLCQQQWYIISSWSECNAFTHATQLEFLVLLKDISPCFESDANTIKLSPVLECYCDIEATKDPNQTDNGFSNPDFDGGHVICINVALIRTGSTEPEDVENNFARQIPRMEDPSDKFQDWYGSLERLNVQHTLPDPLLIKRFEEATLAAATHQPVKVSNFVVEAQLDPETSMLNLGHALYDDPAIDDSSDEDGDDVDHFVPGEEDEDENVLESSTNNRVKAVVSMDESWPTQSKHDAEDDTSNNPHINDPVAAIHRIVSKTRFGNMDVDDLEMVDATTELAKLAKQQQNEDHRAVLAANQLKIAKYVSPVVGKMPSSTISSHHGEKDQEDSKGKDESESESESERESFGRTRESPQSLQSRNRYEVPSWAINDLKALRNVSLDNDKEPDIKRHVLTPTVLGNLKNVRRICFFLDPDLDAPYKCFVIPSLYIDAGDGIIVHSFKTEGQMLLAFRDFMVATHPDMMCGHFFRTYDWRELFARANHVFKDMIPIINHAPDDPIDSQDKMFTCLPVIENGFASTNTDNIWSVAKSIWKDKGKFELSDQLQLESFKRDSELHRDLRNKRSTAMEWKKKTSRTSCFAFMDRALFTPVTLTRKIVSSNNTGTTESVFPTLHGIDDVDSLVAIRLADPSLASYSLKFISGKFLNDAKMDIGIPRMDQCWLQRQYWPVIAYCDWDVILCAGNMNILGLRMGNASTARFSYMSIGDVVNFGQQRRIFAKNAIVSHDCNMVLIKSSVICPSMFSGGYVSMPIGGIYAVCVNCLDYVSYYVTIIMEFNMCFTAYIKPWDNYFNAIDMSAIQKAPKQILVEYRKFAKRLRDVYGAPKHRTRPGAAKCISCMRCKTVDFSMLPTDIFKGIKDASRSEVHPDVVMSVLVKTRDVNFVPSADTKAIIQEVLRRRRDLPTHSDILEERWPPSKVSDGSQQNSTLKLPSWMSMKSAENIGVLTPDKCKTCLSKPWFSKMDKPYDQSLVPDVSLPHDPFREERHAADQDYILPQSSAVSIQSDPEAHFMKGIRRLKPKKHENDPDVFSREDLLTEHEEFDWISPEAWAENRYSICYPEYLAEWEKKKNKTKTKREVFDAKQNKAKGIKVKAVAPPYVPSIASFVMWRPGDFNNQAIRDLKSRFNSGQVDLTDEEASAMSLGFEKKYDPALSSMNEYMASKKIDEWSVESFTNYTSKVVARQTTSAMLHAIGSMTSFDRADHDIQWRRGIDRFGNNTGNVSDLFFARKRVRAMAAEIKGNPLYFDKSKEKWLDRVMMRRWAALDKIQAAIKASANSFFGASGTRTGAIRNTFVAAAITFFSRNYIRFTTYVSVTRWIPPKEVYDRIIAFRRESILGAAKFTGVTERFYKRYLKNAAFPLDGTSAAQTWLYPISTATDFMNTTIESLLSIRTIYGDTDSIMSMSPGVVLGNPNHPTHEMDIPRRELGIDTGKGCSELVTKHYISAGMKYVRLEWEKMFWPFAAPHWLKKKYIGRYWEKAAYFKEDLVRSWLIKRDIPTFQQGLKKPLVAEFMTSMSAQRVSDIFVNMFEKIISSRGVISNIENDVKPYAKSQAFKKTNYSNPAPHYEANKRLADDYPGNEHGLGERVDWVVCTVLGSMSDQRSIASRSYTVRHIQLMLEDKNPKIVEKMSNLRIDTAYYIKSTATVVRDVYRITECPDPIDKEKSTFLSEKSTLARHFAEVKARTGKLPNILPPGAPFPMVCYSAKLWLDEKSGEITPMSDVEWGEKRGWFDEECEKLTNEMWSLNEEGRSSSRQSASVVDNHAFKIISSGLGGQKTEKQVTKVFENMAERFVGKFLTRAVGSLANHDANSKWISTNMARHSTSRYPPATTLRPPSSTPPLESNNSMKVDGKVPVVNPGTLYKPGSILMAFAKITPQQGQVRSKRAAADDPSGMDYSPDAKKTVSL